MRTFFALLVAASLVSGCASTGMSTQGTPKSSLEDPAGKKATTKQGTSKSTSPGEPAPAAAKKEKRGVLMHVLMYLPNRLLDLTDWVRFGVQVGPGLGVDAAATKYVQAQAWSTISVGVGFQTLRDLPVQAGGETGFGVGPVGGIVGSPLPWARSDSAFRLGFHALLVGGHVSIDPVEILDIPLGFLFIDINDDDI